MTSARSVVLLGLPQTAKTSFVAALWQLMQDPFEPDLREVNVTGDRVYLQEIGERLAALQPPKRTDSSSDESLSLRVQLGSSDPVELHIPDVSGESTRTLVEDRFWNPVLKAAVRGACGLMLFVHPGELSSPVHASFPALVLGSSDDATGQEQIFTTRRACTPAKLIDLLENAVPLIDHEPVRLALVVSAWDTVVGKPTPREWLEQELPAVLSMAELDDRFAVEVFGISAQGGRFPDDEAELLKVHSVRERSYARDGDGRDIPFWRPLEWILFG
jgi:hypothetical protein